MTMSASTEIEGVAIGKQVWMVSNLYVDRFRNGDPIPRLQDGMEWATAGGNRQPAWCWNDEMDETSEKALRMFGRFYNWHAVTDPRGIAPEGWHIPTIEEWRALVKHLDGDARAVARLKLDAYWSDWQDVEGSGNGTNESGFSGFPAGRACGGGFFDVSDAAYWWSTQEHDKHDAKAFGLHFHEPSVLWPRYRKADGLAVRCVKDA